MAPSVKQRKIAILGSRSVGKSSLTVQFVEGHFVESYYPTIENTFSREIKHNGQSYLTEIIDTAGQVQDEYSLLNSKHFIGLHGYVLVYSVASRQSFEMVTIIRDKILNHLGAESVPMMIIGNKSDVGSKRKVTAEEGQKLGQDLHCGWIETSARENKNVAKAFEMMIAEIEKAAEPDKPAGGGKALFAAVTQSPYSSGSGPIVCGYRPSTYRKSTGEEKSRSEQSKAQAAKKRPTPKKWDPYSRQGRSDLNAVLQRLQEADFPQPEAADQLVDMPQSPIVNRTLRRKRKGPAKRQPTPEERALENDPWAAMLAQPVRMEIGTRARLPTALMTNWGLVKRAGTDDVYVVPDSLADLDSLDKMNKIADLDARQAGQEWTGQPELGAARATEEKSKHSALLNPGTAPAIRLLPSAQLMDRLTQIYTFVERPGSPSSPRIMRLSVDLTSILPQLWRERIARVRHYDWSQREVEAKTGNKDLKPLPFEATINKTNLKWQPDIEERLLKILRMRLVVCLRRVLHLATTSTSTSTASQLSRESAPIQLQPGLLDLLRNRRESRSGAALVDNEAGLDPAHQSGPWAPYSPPRILLYFADDPADQTLQPDAPCADVLFAEIWRLWRYVGGRQCLADTV
ncbi:hypothetical protein DV736_g2841, partial [Chaetothyriales sp. CBS 134916]